MTLSDDDDDDDDDDKRIQSIDSIRWHAYGSSKELCKKLRN